MRRTGIICILAVALFSVIQPVNTRAYAKEAEGAESMQEMKDELERLSSDDYSDMTSEEFGRLADEYVQLLIQDKQAEGGEIATEYIRNPPLSIQYEKDLFSYLLPNGQIFYASVPNGMITAEAVKMIPLDSFLVTICRDGKMIEQQSAGIYREPGSYQVTMVGYGNTDSISEDFNIYSVEFYFRILAPCSNDISRIYPPEAYSVSYIGCDGKDLNAPEQGYFLKTDGEYEVAFTSDIYPERPYRFKFQRDTKAPEVIFPQEAAGGTAVAPVYYEISEPLEELSLICNGMELSEASDCLEQEGIYRILAGDMAGNRSETTVEVLKKYPLSGNLWIIIIFILILAGAGAALSGRKKMRIL